MRVPFNQIFQVKDGRAEPIAQVEINGVIMGPGVSFGSGVRIKGVELVTLVGKDLDVELEAGVYRVKGYCR